ncbi:MAG: glycosyltransferase [Deltaproteobacteria bacterium]|nr:glycosyltransferase [Deltaproteobacteria bacterium]
MLSARVLYLSFDGVLTPLGYSQIVRPLIELARRGVRYTLVTLETGLDDAAAVDRLRATFKDAGIVWKALPFSAGGGAVAFAKNSARMLGAALAAGRHDLVHARSVQAASAGAMVKRIWRRPLLFDTRGFWADQRALQGLLSPRTAALARVLERSAYAACDGAVMLTELGVDEVRSGRFGAFAKPIVCITTCVDDRAFTMARRREDTVPSAIREALRDKRVVGFVGSVNADYEVDASLALFRRVRAHDANARLLVLTAQADALRDRLRTAAIDPSAAIVTTAPHVEMPAWLNWIDWGLLLLRADHPAKHASMPTKLGELFACGVRPVHYGCNAELAAWVTRAGSGITLPALDASALDAAAHAIVDAAPADLAAARARTMPHFSLLGAVDRYLRVYEALV